MSIRSSNQVTAHEGAYNPREMCSSLLELASFVCLAQRSISRHVTWTRSGRQDKDDPSEELCEVSVGFWHLIPTLLSIRLSASRNISKLEVIRIRSEFFVTIILIINSPVPMNRTDSLDQISKENGGESALQSISTGLQVIEDEDLVAILKDVTSEVNSEPSASEDFHADEDHESSESDSETESNTRVPSSSSSSDSTQRRIPNGATLVGAHIQTSSVCSLAPIVPYVSQHKMATSTIQTSFLASKSTVVPNTQQLVVNCDSNNATATSTSTSSTNNKLHAKPTSNHHQQQQQQQPNVGHERPRYSNLKKKRKQTPIQPHPPAHQTHSLHVQPLPSVQPQHSHSTLNQGEMDTIYLNSNSNVSPDSGIQSEGGVASSPLHLTTIDSTQLMASASTNTLHQHQQHHQQHQHHHHQQQPPPQLHQHNQHTQQHHHQQHQHHQQQSFHPALHGATNFNPTPTANFGQMTLWNGIASQQTPYYHTGQFLQQPLTVQSAATGFQVHANGLLSPNSTIIQSRLTPQPALNHLSPQFSSPMSIPAAIISAVSTTTAKATLSTATSASLVITESQKNRINVTPPPVLLPAINPQISPALHDNKRGRGRPKSSKTNNAANNKAPKKVTMECGSQTEESVLDGRYSTDSDGSGGYLPPPSPVYMGACEPFGRGRPRKDPPTLEPQVEVLDRGQGKDKPTERRDVGSGSFRTKPKSKSPGGKKTKYELITLDSDDNSDSSDADDDRMRMKARHKATRDYLELKQLSKQTTMLPVKRIVKSKEKRIPPEEINVKRSSLIIEPSVVKKKHVVSKPLPSTALPPRSVTPKSSDNGRDPSLSPIRPVPPQKSSPESASTNMSNNHRRHQYSSPSNHMSSHTSNDVVVKGANRVPRKEAFVARNEHSENPFRSGKVEPLFAKKYHTVKPDFLADLSTSSTYRVAKPATGGRDSNRDSSSSLPRSQSPMQRNDPRGSGLCVESSRVLTKASLKELSSFSAAASANVNTGGASTKTMLSVLAEANKRAKPGRKKRGRRSKSSEWSESLSSSRGRKQSSSRVNSPGSSCHSSNRSPFSPRSTGDFSNARDTNKYSDLIDCSEGYRTASSNSRNYNPKKKKEKAKAGKGWKSKHKNVIDPVFLSEVERLIQGIASCQVETKLSSDIWPDRPHDSVPSIFRKRKILVPTNNLLGPSTTSSGRSKNSGEKRKSRSKRNSVNTKESKEDSRDPIHLVAKHDPSPSKKDNPQNHLPNADASEQRLPLKKRHHHHMTTKGDQDNESGHSSSASSALSPPITASQAYKKKEAQKAAPKRLSQDRPGPASSKNRGLQGTSSSSVSGNPTAATTNSATNPIHQARRNSRERTSGAVQDGGKHSATATKAPLKVLEESSEAILIKYGGKISPLVNSANLPLRPSSPATTKSVNIVDSLAACVDKHLGPKPGSGKEVNKPLRVDVHPPTRNRSASPAQPASTSTLPTTPRKRHLLEMRKKESSSLPVVQVHHSKKFNNEPPTLQKETGTRSSPSSCSSSSSPPPISLLLKTGSNSSAVGSPKESVFEISSPIKTSPPRLSPQYAPIASKHHQEDKPKSKHKDHKRITLRISKDRLSFEKSEDSEEKSESDGDDLFSRLQKSGPTRRVKISALKTAKFVPSDSPMGSDEDQHHSSGRDSPPTKIPKLIISQAKGPERPLTERQKALVAAKEAAEEISASLAAMSMRKPLAMIKLARAMGDDDDDGDDQPLKPVGTSDKTTIGMAPVTKSAESRKSSAVETEEIKLIKPKILKAQPKAQSEPKGRSKPGPKSKRRSINLQKCSVRVHKLRPEDIIESSPSPMSVHEDAMEIIANANPKRAGEGNLPKSVFKQTTEMINPSVEETSIADSIVKDITNFEARNDNQTDKDKDAKTPVVPSILKKKRRRANKTGFPSIKKKKRLQSQDSAASDGSTSRSRSTSKRASRHMSGDPKVPSRSSARAAKLKPSDNPTPSPNLSRDHSLDPPTDVGNVPEIQKSSVLPSPQPEEPEQPPTPLKRPRGRPPKKRQTANSMVVVKPTDPIKQTLPELVVASTTSSQENKRAFSRESSFEDFQQPSKRSRLYEDMDDDLDCLALLPPIGPESGPSSEAPSGNEGEDSRSSSLNRKQKKASFFKKKTLTAGLFSNHYKSMDTESYDNSTSLRKPPPYRPEDHEHGLLPPPYYCGRQLRQKREDFQLPYDLWWLHMNKQLPGRDIVATWNYKKIKNNVYYDVKPISQFESQSCQCSRVLNEDEFGCGEECINRMTYSECDARLCPLGEKCANNAIQKHRAVHGLERFMTENKGWGMRSKVPIQSGSFIIEYVGEVVSEREFKHRMTSIYAQDSHHYCLHMDGGIVIDGHRMGGECRFVNHSCEPNCEIQKWTVNGLYRMALFSLKDIKPGDELCYDYNFSLFNPHEGQSCRCGSEKCRGVIGGRSQRLTNDEDKDASRERRRNSKIKRSDSNQPTSRLSVLAPMKALSGPQLSFVRERRCFLIRNWEKVRKVRENIQRKVNGQLTQQRKDDQASKPEEMILTGLTALTTARSMQTRRLTIAQDDPNVNKVIKLAQLLREIFAQVTTVNDESGSAIARHFFSPPLKGKHGDYLTHITDPIDFQTIDRNINTGAYFSALQFDQDVLRLCQNNLRYYGSTSEEGKAALKIRQLYNAIKQEYHAALVEIVGQSESFCFRKREESPPEEDVIRCPCGQYKDEGLMVQCEKCHVWQHGDCVGQNGEFKDDDQFFCEECVPKNISLDIVLSPQPEYASPGETYYTSLMREKLQIRVGDTVYVLRAFKEDQKSPTESDSGSKSPKPPAEKNEREFNQGGIPHKMMSPMKGPSIEGSTLAKGNYPTFKTVDENITTADMDIFRIERLWINEKGERIAFGHHYLRPHETFHEPSRKFFYNEVFRVPIYEVLPLDSIWGQCWVMDIPTFSKGRPVGSQEEHVYICEYRVDKSARLFNKISKPKHPICTKWFAFDFFDQKLKPQRTYTPHEVPEKWRASTTPRNRSLEDDSRSSSSRSDSIVSHKGHQNHTPHTSNHRRTNNSLSASLGSQFLTSALSKPLKLSLKDRSKKKTKLDATLLRLLGQIPGKNPIDASYLLESDKRLRKKTNSTPSHNHHPS
eukprot:TCALIF_03449-PA protein Name:"Similar to Ash1l Histone-lysine N-methyltransferase ASH1L (Mus musculus)" AED:0.06 eAED:0.06 QI:0/0.28/0.25/0.37/1/1/8/407/3102